MAEETRERSTTVSLMMTSETEQGTILKPQT